MEAQTLNEHCLCTRSDRQKLQNLLKDGGLPEPGGLTGQNTQTGQSALFAEFPVFVADSEIADMTAIVAAVQRVAHHPALVAHALAEAPPIAAIDQGTRGVVYGYDFHLSETGPQLIEVNTNAGGLLLNYALSRSQEPCCDAVAPLLQHLTATPDLEGRLLESFSSEFRSARGTEATLRTIAIVDEQPSSQFLYPEFQLYGELFRRAGIQAHILDPAELSYRDAGLWWGVERVDLIYNRLTDFYLEEHRHAHLAQAYRDGAVVLTPHPRAHALLANKHHLALWSDAQRLRQFGVDESSIQTLQNGLPHAEVVSKENRARLWSERKRYFFKPACGYGGKAAYRGDKISRATFDQQVTDGYLAQTTVKPTERVVRVSGELVRLKLDVRAYVDQQQIVLLAARLYQGQTTNFRTPGGGFAAVLAWPQKGEQPVSGRP